MSPYFKGQYVVVVISSLGTAKISRVAHVDDQQVVLENGRILDPHGVVETNASDHGCFIVPLTSEDGKSVTDLDDYVDDLNRRVPLYSDDDAVYSVFMGKNNDPRVHQLVAELHGIAVAEATRYCSKPIVALAKEICGPDAEQIRQSFAALNVTVRITKKN